MQLALVILASVVVAPVLIFAGWAVIDSRGWSEPPMRRR